MCIRDRDITLPDGSVVDATQAKYTVDKNGVYNFSVRDYCGNVLTYPVEEMCIRDSILALFTGRNESEAIVDPRHLEQIMESPDCLLYTSRCV